MDGGGQVRLGRGEVEGKLARMDRIMAALGPRGAAGVRTVYLDGPDRRPRHRSVAVAVADHLGPFLTSVGVPRGSTEPP